MPRRTFGQTWWGKAWLDALEQRALADPNRLPRGRTYARQGRVQNLELSPGLLEAQVLGTDTYSTKLHVRQLSPTEWNQVFDVVMEAAANSAALLAGEVPPSIGDLVLPDRGDLGPDCSCPDWAEPCKHASALCYSTADIFDQDPFAVLMLRGRSRQQVLHEVRQRRTLALGVDFSDTSNLPRGTDPGIDARSAYNHEAVASRRSVIAPLSPNERYRLAIQAPADAGIPAQDLAAAVTDAARRAWQMLASDASSALSLSIGEDVVRRASNATPAELAEIARHTSLDPLELELAARAWKEAGRAGYLVSRKRWGPAALQMNPGIEVLGPNAKVRGNRVSIPDHQLRLDEDHNWWYFQTDDRLGWVLKAGPSKDPAELVDPEAL